MTLFLASSGLSALPQFTPEPSSTRVGFIATAAELDENPSWIHRDSDALMDMGYDVFLIVMTGVEHAQLREMVQRLDVLVIAGGDAYYLLQQMRLTGFDEIIDEFIARGGIYVGSSAGAIVAGPNIDDVAEISQRDGAPNLTSTVGLGLSEYSVLPHADSDTPRFLDHHSDVLTRSHEGKVVRLTNDEALVLHDGETKIVRSPRT